MNTKYIFVTGGVVSGLGKGITAASVGRLLKNRGYKVKQKTSYNTKYFLDLSEVLIALSICSVTNPIIEKALNELEKLRGCDAHSSYIIEKSELNASFAS